MDIPVFRRESEKRSDIRSKTGSQMTCRYFEQAVTDAYQTDEDKTAAIDLSIKHSPSLSNDIEKGRKFKVSYPYSTVYKNASVTKPLAYCTPNPVPNVPENNQVRLLEFRGAQLAAFTVEERDLICLPQAFELFLKHLVGGLHTVYTKLKRLEITPVVCNVEQVRILRGLGAIQPGVNRCKLIAPQEFDILYADCTNSRLVSLCWFER